MVQSAASPIDTVQFGTVAEPAPGYTAKLAKLAEQLGFDLLLCPDTQNLAGDPYGQLNLAAAINGQVLTCQPCRRS